MSPHERAVLFTLAIADAPGTFESPYTAVLDLKPHGSIFEYACHEGNRSRANILSAARAEERER